MSSRSIDTSSHGKARFTKPSSGTVQNSLEALRAAGGSSRYSDGDTLWIKLVADET